MQENKFKQFFKNNFIYFIIAFTCVAYVTYGMVRMEQSGKTLLEIIGSGIVIFLVSYLISLLFSYQGMLSGDRNEEVIKTNKLHSKCVEDIDPKINEMDEWCEVQNVKALKTVRKQILNKEGLRYTDCFDEDGTALDVDFSRKAIDKDTKHLKRTDKAKYRVEVAKIKHFNKLQRAREIAFRKAVRTKVTPITTDAITAISIKHNDPNNLGMDRRTYQKREARSSLLSKLIIGLVFSYFTFSFVLGWEYMIVALVQVAIFLLMGAIKFVQSYYFVIEDLRKRTVRQINYIQRFKCDKGLATKQEIAKECETLKDSKTAIAGVVENEIIGGQNDR